MLGTSFYAVLNGGEAADGEVEGLRHPYGTGYLYDKLSGGIDEIQ